MESPTVTFSASFEAGLGMSQLMSKDGLWQEYLLGLSRFISQEQFRPWARSTQHQQCFSTLRNPSEGGTLDYLSWGRPCGRESLATSVWSPGKTLAARTVVWMEKILGPRGLTLSEWFQSLFPNFLIWEKEKIYFVRFLWGKEMRPWI